MTSLNVAYEQSAIYSIFEPAVRDDSITKYQYSPFDENSGALGQNNGFPTQGTQYKFESGSTSVLSLPSRSYLRFNLQMYNTPLGGALTPLTSATGVVLQNNFPLFQRFAFTMGGRPIDSTEQYAETKALMKSLIDYSMDSGEGSFIDECYYPDSGLNPWYMGWNTAGTTKNDHIVSYNGNAIVPGPCLAILEDETVLTTAQTAGTIITATVGSAISAVSTTLQAVKDTCYNAGVLYRYRLVWGQFKNNITSVQTQGLVQIKVPCWRWADVLRVDKFYVGDPIGIECNVGGPNLNYMFQKVLTKTAVPTSGTIATGVYPFTNAVNYASTDTSYYSFKVLNLMWQLPTVTPNQQLYTDIKAQMLSKKSGVRQFHSVYVTRVAHNPQNSSINYLIKNTDDRIEAIYVGYRWQKLENDVTQINNSQVFHPVTNSILTETILLGDTQYPMVAYRPNIDNRTGPMEEYQTLKELSNRVFDYEGGAIINYSAFLNHYNLRAMDTRYNDSDPSYTSGQSREVRYTAEFQFPSIAPGVPAVPATAGYTQFNTPPDWGSLNIYFFIVSTKERVLNFSNGQTTFIS